MTARNLSITTAHKLYQWLYKSSRCAYCGEAATTEDHFMPISVAAWMIRQGHQPKSLWLVPACLECNLIAGDEVFETLVAKRQYIQQKLSHRYRKLLRMPSWRSDELSLLGHSLKQFITSSLGESRIIRERLSWQGEIDESGVTASNVKRNSTHHEPGQNSAQPLASRNGTTTSDKSWSNSGRRRRKPPVEVKSDKKIEEMEL